MTLRFLGYLKKRIVGKPRRVPAVLAASRAGDDVGPLAASKGASDDIHSRASDDWQSVNALVSIALQDGDTDRAAELCRAYILRNQDCSEAYVKLANLFASLRRYEEALANYDQAIAAKPIDARTLCDRGVVLEILQRFDEALASYDRAVSLAPGDFAAQYSRASMLRKLGNLAEALISYDRAIAIKSDHKEAYFYRGVVLHGLQRFEAAVASYDKAIQLTPSELSPYVAHSSRGYSLIALARFEMALASFEQAISSRSDYAEAYQGRGLALHQLGHFDQALKSYEKVIALNADYAAAYVNAGDTLFRLDRYEEAVASYDKAIDLGVCEARVFWFKGLALRLIRRLDECLHSYERAINLNSGYTECIVDRAHVLLELGRYDEALAGYDRAVELNPDSVIALQGRGFALLRLGQPQAAITAIEQALSVNPEQEYLPGLRRHLKMQICDWDGLDADLERLAFGLKAGASLSTPFPMLSLIDSTSVHRAAAKLWADNMFPRNDALGPISAQGGSDKIHVAYFSPDFRNHPVSLLTAELFETHDRSRFTVSAFAFGPECEDSVRMRLESAFDNFIDVADKTDLEVASLARSMGVDIAVDLCGFTEHCRTGIFALRAAPIQVSYLGYLGTMAAPYMDYLLADPIIIPHSERGNYTERIVYLPSYQANDSTRRISDRIHTREQLRVPSDAFVFCCFNANYKITPTTFSTWMRILNRVSGSVLFLYADNHSAEQNIRREAERRGVDPGRIVLGEKLVFEEYLARYRAMDLFLDTLPYNAGTTASDALWAGLPVLTCSGRAFAGRVAASLLSAINLPELITRTDAEYEDIAVKLATTPAMLKNIREKLALNRLSAPLFDTATFTRNLETAYVQMLKRFHEKLPPEDLHVAGLARATPTWRSK